MIIVYIEFNYYMTILDYRQELEFINPCADPSTDFFVMKSDNEEQLVGNKLTRRLKSLNRIEGCCETLEQNLQTEKWQIVMNLMKFSIRVDNCFSYYSLIRLLYLSTFTMQCLEISKQTNAKADDSNLHT